MKKILTIIALCILFTSYYANAQQKDSLIKVTEGVYTIQGLVGNVSFLVTSKSVILFDAGNDPQGMPRIEKQIATVTDKKISHVILTHYHYDHVDGLNSLPAGIPIIAHINTKKNLENRASGTKKELEVTLQKCDSVKIVLSKLKISDNQYVKTDSMLKAFTKKAEELKNTKYTYPTELFDNIMSFVDGNDTIDLTYPGKAHTDGDVVVCFRNRKTLVMGDLLFNKVYPYIDPLGNTANWAVQLERFAKSGNTYFIPGHMNTATSEDLLLFANYHKDLRAAVKKMKDEGKSIDEIKKTLKLPAYSTFGFEFFREQNMEAVYEQLK